MKRATITLTDDLERELNEYLSEQDAPPTLTTLVQAALKDYIRQRRLKERGFEPAQGSFWMEPLEEIDDQGEPDVSLNHDFYFGKP